MVASAVASRSSGRNFLRRRDDLRPVLMSDDCGLGAWLLMELGRTQARDYCRWPVVPVLVCRAGGRAPSFCEGVNGVTPPDASRDVIPCRWEIFLYLPGILRWEPSFKSTSQQPPRSQVAGAGHGHGSSTRSTTLSDVPIERLEGRESRWSCAIGWGFTVHCPRALRNTQLSEVWF